MIGITCPGCEKQLQVKDELAGKKVKCPKCGEIVTVPGARVAGEERQQAAAARARAEEEESERDTEDEEESEAPAKKERRGERAGDRMRNRGGSKPAKSNLPMILGIIGGVLLLVCGGAALGVYYLVHKATQVVQQMASDFSAMATAHTGFTLDTRFGGPDTTPTNPGATSMTAPGKETSEEPMPTRPTFATNTNNTKPTSPETRPSATTATRPMPTRPAPEPTKPRPPETKKAEPKKPDPAAAAMKAEEAADKKLAQADKVVQEAQAEIAKKHAAQAQKLINQAKQDYEKIIKEHPTTQAAQVALLRLQQLR